MVAKTCVHGTLTPMQRQSMLHCMRTNTQQLARLQHQKCLHPYLHSHAYTSVHMHTHTLDVPLGGLGSGSTFGNMALTLSAIRSAMAWCFLDRAANPGVLPLSFTGSRSVSSRSTRYRTTSMWPSAVAACRAVSPSWVSCCVPEAAVVEEVGKEVYVALQAEGGGGGGQALHCMCMLVNIILC